MSFLNIKQCYIKLDNKFPQIHYRGGSVINNIDSVIPRIRPSQTFYGCSLVRHFQSMNIYSLNNSDAIRNSRDKLYSLQCLQEVGIDIPGTGFANSPVETDELIDVCFLQLTKDVFAKDDAHVHDRSNGDRYTGEGDHVGINMEHFHPDEGQ